MNEVLIRIEGNAGRITLNRPDALNALTYAMVEHIETALLAWRDDPKVKLVVVDATGDRAFCAGGDIAKMYETAKAGDFDYGRRFWRDEYRLNALIAKFPKPFVSFMQGYTMGGGVGIACHGSHRIVCENSKIAMPECSIGLIPDVGGTLLLANAPGHLGEYLALSGDQMQAGDAIFAGFATGFIPITKWPMAIEELVNSGTTDVIDQVSETPETGKLQQAMAEIDLHYDGASAVEIANNVSQSNTIDHLGAKLLRACPLSAACAIELIHMVRKKPTIEYALQMEYRFTSRSASDGDFIEGIRAAVIDKDRKPHWRHDSIGDVTLNEVSHMLSPLGKEELNLGETR